MEPLAIAMLVLAGVLVGGIVLLGRFYPGSGAEQLDWRPTRSPELEARVREDLRVRSSLRDAESRREA